MKGIIHLTFPTAVTFNFTGAIVIILNWDYNLLLHLRIMIQFIQHH